MSLASGSDEQYILKPKPAPWFQRINWQTWVSVISLVISGLSILFNWQLVRIGNRQAQAAESQTAIAAQALRSADDTARDQKRDVERSRKAAENSATAAKKLVDGMVRSAAAAESSAKAGHEALSLNLRSLVLNNQPDVEVLNLRLTKEPTLNEKPIVEVHFFNPGRGRAIETEVHGWMNMLPQIAFDYPERPPISVVDLAPSVNNNNWVSVEVTTALPLFPPLLAAISNGTLKLFVYGLVRYSDDTLERRVTHTLHWCGFYEPTSRDKLALMICREGNFTTKEK